MASWWYIADNQRQGPVTLPTLKKLLQHRVLGAESFVWRKGLKQWTPINLLEEFKPLLSDLPPPLPVTVPRINPPAKPVIASADLHRRRVAGLILACVLLTAGTSAFFMSKKPTLDWFTYVNKKTFTGLFFPKQTERQAPSPPVILDGHRWQNPFTLKQTDIDSGWTIKQLASGHQDTYASSFISENIVVNLSVAPAQNQTLPQLVDYLKTHESSLHFINSGVFSQTGELSIWTGIAINPNDQHKNYVVHVQDAKFCYGILIAAINQQTAASVSRLEALIANLDNTFRGD